jgi:glycine dehydrogenase
MSRPQHLNISRRLYGPGLHTVRPMVATRNLRTLFARSLLHRWALPQCYRSVGFVLEGLVAATETAILSANYIAARLADHYDIHFSGGKAHLHGGGVAHECILDLRPLKDSCGISAEDVAKRLIDYGFHAPTLSFPVPGTLMVEPTESEPLHELDRFCDAMIAIRAEINKVETGAWPPLANPLKNAPHTAQALLAADWPQPYSREQAAYPLASVRTNKYWVPVGRVDNVHGDRNLMCSCAPVADYQVE